jgi:hypothetical protein
MVDALSISPSVIAQNFTRKRHSDCRGGPILEKNTVRAVSYLPLAKSGEAPGLESGPLLKVYHSIQECAYKAQ